MSTEGRSAQQLAIAMCAGLFRNLASFSASMPLPLSTATYACWSRL